tara:strand:- start:195 stop:710 length:516 start_codon:yes stop_codon:yes gene_type:complete
MSGIISDNVGRSTGLIKAAGGGGKIGQVVSAIKTDRATTTSTSYVTTGLAVAITPVATSSKILILVCAALNSKYSGHQTMAIIDGGNCATYIGDAATGIEAAMTHIGTYDLKDQHPFTLMYLDSPSTTSEVTYTLHYLAKTGGGAVLNGSFTQYDHTGNDASTITAMEVLA